MKTEFFRRLKPQLSRNERLKKAADMIWKCFVFSCLPFLAAAVITLIWYVTIYKHHYHFDEKMENIISSAWIPTFGVLYSLLVVVVFTTVWNEYKAMRTAVKKYDFYTFMELRDEEMSPLVYLMMTIFSGAILLGFMCLQYPSIKGGLVVTFSTSYLLSLIFFVVVEIDDPCGGLWFIKNIPHEWLDIDVKAHRRRRHEQEKVKFQGELTSSAGTTIRVTGSVEPARMPPDAHTAPSN